MLATVPFFDTDLYDLAGLVRLGEQIWATGDARDRGHLTDARATCLTMQP